MKYGGKLLTPISSFAFPIGFRLTKKRLLASDENERRGSRVDETEEESLEEFTKRILRQSTPFLESISAELSMKICFLPDQILAEPEPYLAG